MAKKKMKVVDAPKYDQHGVMCSGYKKSGRRKKVAKKY